MKFHWSVLLAVALVAPAVFAHDYRQGALMIDHPWSRPTPPGTPMGVGYMSITNNGDGPITLIGASSTRAEQVSIHESRIEAGVMRMEPLQDGLVIPAGETVELKPHSFHLMLENLSGPLREGESIPLALDFEGAGDMAVELKVESLDGPAMDGDIGRGMEMDHTGHSGAGMNHGGH